MPVCWVVVGVAGSAAGAWGAACYEVAAGAASSKAGITGSEVIGGPSYLIGTTEQIRDDLKECRAVWGFSYIVLGEESYEAMAPVVEDLAGS